MQPIRRARGGRFARSWLPDALLIAVLVAALWGKVLVAAAAGGERGGFVLLRDAVSTPRPPLSDGALGVGQQAARAVPQDTAMWAVQGVFRLLGLPEALVLPLLVALALALLGVAGRGWARVAAPAAARSFWLRAPAIVLAVWNPFVVERLAQGAWSLLLGVAAAALIPLLFLTAEERGAHRLPRDLRIHAGVAALIALAAFTPTGLVMVVIACGIGSFAGRMSRAARWHTDSEVALVPEPGASAFGEAALAPTDTGDNDPDEEDQHSPIVVGRPGRIELVAVLALVISALPVVIATAFGWGSGSDGLQLGATDLGLSSSAAGVAAFAARAEPLLGTLGSLGSLGGIWNADAVPGSRHSAWALLLSAALIAVFSVGTVLAIIGSRRRSGTADPVRDIALRFAVTGAVVVVLLVAIAATGLGQTVVTSFVDSFPAAGVVRDGQKWVGLAIPGFVVALTLCVERASTALAPRTGAMGAVAAAFGLVPLLAVPDAPVFLAEQFQATRYGEGWTEVDSIVADWEGSGAGAGANAGAGADAGTGAGAGASAAAGVLVLPDGSFRRTPLWADGRPVLDPAARLLHAPVLASGDLYVGGQAVEGEGTKARVAETELIAGAHPARLTALGVGWVLEERTSAGERGESAETLAHAELVFQDDELSLWRLPANNGEPQAPAASTGARTAAVAAHIAWGALLLGGIAVAPGATVTRRGRSGARRHRGNGPHGRSMPGGGQ
ncbi:hypothetical protein [Dietzia sp.]|uniref:hypothetical protein n=1 Tax=Dietzia sp. TaxID=1871616 RepID=UPI002FD9E3B3